MAISYMYKDGITKLLCVGPTYIHRTSPEVPFHNTLFEYTTSTVTIKLARDFITKGAHL